MSIFNVVSSRILKLRRNALILTLTATKPLNVVQTFEARINIKIGVGSKNSIENIFQTSKSKKIYENNSKPDLNHLFLFCIHRFTYKLNKYNL